MASVWVMVLAGSLENGKNFHVQVNGVIEPGEVLDWQKLIETPTAMALKLDAVNYAISEKVEILLAWDTEDEENEPHVFLPLNGRGRLDFDSVSGLRNTVEKGKTGDVLIHAYPTGDLTRRSHFTLSLDFSTQRI